MKMKNLDPIQTLEFYKSLVWPEVNKYLKNPEFPKTFEVTEKQKQLEEFHWKLTNDYPERKGKYLRPTLLVLSGLCMGCKLEKLLQSAAAMQLSEEWILIHDDVEDDSDLRRGKPSLHKIYGHELAVNAGDALHAVMWKTVFDNLYLLGVDKTTEVFNEFYKIIMRTAFGQTIDIKWINENKLDFDLEDWYFIADTKSSYYTIAGPIRLGAIIAGANNKQLDLLSEFGLHLGRVFQLVDDILDVTTDFNGLKKQGGDIYEGKRTVMLEHLLKTSNSTDRNKLERILNKNRSTKSKEEVDWVIQKMNSYKSIDYAKGVAKIHKEKAEDIFDNKLDFLSHNPERKQLRSLIDFILNRDH